MFPRWGKHVPKMVANMFPRWVKHVPKMGQTCSQDGANMFPRWGKHVPKMGQNYRWGNCVSES